MKKFWTLLLFVSCVAFGASSYEYVLSDFSAERQAEAAACTVQKCEERHGMTKLDKTPFGQTFEFTWRSRTVSVHCMRKVWIFGELGCSVER